MKVLNHFLGLFVITILVGMTSCTEQGLDINKNLAPTNKSAEAVLDIAPILVSSVAYNLSGDLFTAINFTIEDEIIMLTTNYQGGCTTAQFQLVADPQVQYDVGNTPMFNSKLILDNTDKCNYTVRETVSYDLTPLQQSGSNKVILNIENFGKVTYSY